MDFFGYKWNKVYDMFIFKKNLIVLDGSFLMKRNCLVYFIQLWDFMGFVIFVIIEFRIDL